MHRTGDDVNRGLDLVLRVINTDAEPHGRERDLSGDAHCQKCGRRFRGSARAGTAERDAHALQIECDEERFAIDTGERDIERVRKPMFDGSVHNDGGTSCAEFMFKTIPQFLHEVRAIVALLVSKPQCCRHAGGKGHTFGSRSVALFLVSPEECWRGVGPCTKQQSSDAPRTMELVRSQRQRGGAEGLKVDFDLADRLNGVHMQRNPARSTLLGNALHLLNNSGLVMSRQDCDKNRVFPGHSSERVRPEHSVRSNGNQVMLEAARRQMADGLLRGRVLCRRSDNNSLTLIAESMNSKIGRFGSSAGEDDFLRAGVQDLRDCFAGIFQNAPGDAAGRMTTAGIRIGVDHHPRDRFHDFGERSCCRVVIKVDRHESALTGTSGR